MWAATAIVLRVIFDVFRVVDAVTVLDCDATRFKL
jgi:hypothetical protein